MNVKGGRDSVSVADWQSVRTVCRPKEPPAADGGSGTAVDRGRHCSSASSSSCWPKKSRVTRERRREAISEKDSHERRKLCPALRALAGLLEVDKRGRYTWTSSACHWSSAVLSHESKISRRSRSPTSSLYYACGTHGVVTCVKRS
jgi:hypothetical protein